MNIKNTPVFILAGGLGTRLRSVVSDLPKPMAPVAGKPFLEFLILNFANQGFTKFVLLTGYKSEIIENYFGNGEKWGLQINYAVEKDRLGTGGAVKNALKSFPSENFFLINGDSFFDVSLDELFDEKQNCLSLKKIEDTERYGLVGLGEGNKITQFKEKKTNAGSGLINGGVYFFQSKAFEQKEQDKFSLEEEILPMLVNEKILLGRTFTGKFLDIGIPEDYAKAESFLGL